MTSCLWPFSSQSKPLVLPGHEGPDFPYTQIGERFFPMVDLAIHRNFQTIKIRALVDSGASLSLFRPELAVYLGLKVEQGRAITLEAVSSSISGYVHDLNVEINGKKFTLPTAFLTKPHSSFNILGREGFFENFVVSFDEKNKIIRLG